jgi:hypothetical protein
VEPEDDYTHPAGPEPNFNESMYFRFRDPEQGIGGFFRLANRPNEGRGERTVCLFLPGGHVAFGFERPAVHANEALRGAGLAFSVDIPFRQLGVEFDGSVHLLADPRAMADPKKALANSPLLDCSAALSFAAAAPAYAETFDGDGESFAPNHYEQLMTVTGRIRLGERAFDIQGGGLRDHSWGPRSWQAPWFYRWVHGTSGGIGFMGAYFGAEDGSALRGGFVWDGHTLHGCDDVRITTERDDTQYQRAVTVKLRSGSRAWSFTGSVDNVVPLRHRRPDGTAVTRIVEGATVWSGDDGAVLHGMTEYLDQVINGVPVGLAV